MPEMFSYIFGSLDHAEKNIRNMDRALRRQCRINQCLARNLTALTMVAAVYIVIQNKKLEKLSREIEEIKREGD